jgi:flagellar M-ring protein FliF
VSVPGVVKGWCDLHARFGKLSLKEVLAPAIRYAREGAPVTELVAHYWARSVPVLGKYEGFKETFTVEGRAPTKGEVWRNPGLAKTLEAIAEGGAPAFYEGEIARTIATISEVSSARVHIAMGKDSLFGESRPAKASVVLKLKGQRTWSAATINGVSNLVAASVEGLRPDAVVILDSFGRPLARPNADADDPMGAAQLERQARLEREMATRVTALLEPVVGMDRVRVNVAIRLDPQTQDETEERWDPNAVVRSRQMTADGVPASGGPAQVAGARGNTPPPAAPPSQAAASTTVSPLAGGTAGAGRAAETTNYEISRTTRRTHQPSGDIERLSVAVILDDDQVASRDKAGALVVKRAPRTPAEIKKIQGLVAAAVGLDASRGDQLTVENVAFDEPIVEDVPTPSVLERITPKIWESGRLAVMAGMGILVLLFLRPLLKRSTALATNAVAVVATAMPMPAAVPAPAGPAIKTVSDIESEIEAQIDAAAAAKMGESRRLPVLTRRVSALSTKEPENIARLLRTWMNEDHR